MQLETFLSMQPFKAASQPHRFEQQKRREAFLSSPACHFHQLNTAG